MLLYAYITEQYANVLVRFSALGTNSRPSYVVSISTSVCMRQPILEAQLYMMLAAVYCM